MTIATEIMHISANANDADARAQECTENIEQDWEHEATFYKFADGSALVVSGSQVNAYESIKAAYKAVAA